MLLRLQRVKIMHNISNKLSFKSYREPLMNFNFFTSKREELIFTENVANIANFFFSSVLILTFFVIKSDSTPNFVKVTFFLGHTV